MPAKVSKVSLTGFRGATAPVEISFDTTKPVVLVFGENGAGKSTLADAFDFACNLRCGSLEDRSLPGQAKTYLPALRGGPKTLTVTLSTTSGDFRATLMKGTPVLTPPDGCPDARILRRSNILQLVNAQPKQRFEQLKSFITLPGIEKSENALREACREEDNKFNESVRSLNQAKTELEKLWGAEGNPGEDALQWAKDEAEKDVAELETSVQSITTIEENFEKAGGKLCALDIATSELTSARGEQKSAEEELERIERKKPDSDTKLLKLLQDARSFIASMRPRQCPVCEQGIEAATLVKRLDARTFEMTELSGAMKTVSGARNKVAGKEAIFAQARCDFVQAITKLAVALRACPLGEVNLLSTSWSYFQDILVPTKGAEELEAKARQFWTDAHPCWQPLIDLRKAQEKSLNQRNAIKGLADTHTEQTEYTRNHEMLSRKLNRALEILSQERKNYVGGVLDTISLEVERLYTALHPGEGIGKIRFYLKPRAIGSLEMDGSFQNAKELPPQAYYSESHLDTLGICVFLALTKHYRTENTIVVLDDVVTSVDGAHLDRFMAMLHSEAKHFNQLIVTTHYRPWRDRYRWAKGPTANTQVIELGQWTLENGLHAGPFTTAISELRAALQGHNFDRQKIASKAGIVLESILDFLTVKYRCAVPRNTRNEYTLGDLASAVGKKLSESLRCRVRTTQGRDDTDVYIKPLIDSASGSHWIRNRVGCHFSHTGSDITDPEIRSFGASVLCLADTLVCRSCGALPSRRPSGSYWECACGKLELYPLVNPGADPGTVDDEI